MNKHIIISEQQKEQVQGNYGLYSAIEPVVCSDRNYIIPEACLNDKDLVEVKSLLQSMVEEDNIQDIIDLPDSGTIEAGRIYRYSEGIDNGYSGLVVCVQEHERTIYPPEETPALFSFFRENSDELQWIPNEYVQLGWKRIYNGVTYTVIQAHMTLETWTPDVTPALWEAEIIEEDYPVWVQPPGAHDAYQKGDRVYYPTVDGLLYESLIDANVWSPVAYPQGWKVIE